MSPKRHIVDDWCSNQLVQFPSLMSNTKKYMADRKSYADRWPEWCSLPMAMMKSIISNDKSIKNPTAITNEVGSVTMYRLMATLLWMQTKMVYRYTADFTAEMEKSSLKGDIPIEVLHRLPYDCVFIEAPVTIHDIEAIGFFVWMGQDPMSKKPELCLLYMLQDGHTYKFPIVLTGGNIEQAYEAKFRSVVNSPEVRESDRECLLELMLQEMADQKQTMEKALNLVLYICSENADIKCVSRQRPVAPSQIPKNYTAWDVGTRISHALRKNTASSDQPAHRNHSSHTSPRPHIRRAHWHHYWTGPRTGERKLVLRWLHPVLIGDENADLPTAIASITK